MEYTGFWRMRDKIGMPLDEIHISGDVPLCTWYSTLRKRRARFSLGLIVFSSSKLIAALNLLRIKDMKHPEVGVAGHDWHLSKRRCQHD